jgi:hypothetical protein
MATARNTFGSTGTQAAALAAGGDTNNALSFTTATEEWTGDILTAGSKTLTVS